MNYPFIFRSTFRNFAINREDTLSRHKKERDSFVLRSTFRNFAASQRRYSRLAIKTKTSLFVLYCARLFVTLSSNHFYTTMKRTFLTLIILATALTAMAQATQPCIVKQYNQKQQKTPLAGVQVEVRDAGSVASGADGRFTLQFATLKPGDRVTLRHITKTGYEIFNKHAIDQWTIARGATFEIVLVQSAYFAQLKSNLTQSSTENYKKKYEQEKAEKERLLREGKLMEEEYRRQLNELEDQYDDALKNLDNYIDQFARIDLSEVSEEEQRILDMVQEGKIQEAVLAYDKLDLSKKLTSETNDYLELSKVVKTAEEIRSQKRMNIDALYESIYRQVSTMVMAENHEEATKILLSAMSDFSKLFDEDPATNRPQFADLQFRVGEMLADHQWRGEKEAGKYFADALSNYLILYDSLPDQYSASVANAKIRLGKCKVYEKDYAGAETMYLEALTIWKQQIELDGLKYLKELAYTQHLLGKLYSQWTSRNDQAIEFFQAALDNYAQLAQGDIMAHLPDVASIKLEMASVFKESKDLEKAEYFLLEALNDYALLADKNPYYLEILEYNQREIGDFYSKIWSGLKTLSERNPENLEVMETKQEALGYFYGKLWNDFKTGDLFAKAEKYYKAACQTALKKGEELSVLSRLNWTDLSSLYLMNNEDQKAQDCIQEYNEIIAKYENTPLNDSIGIKTEFDMAELYLWDGNPEKALQYYQDAMRMDLNKGENDHSVLIHLDMALCLMCLGDSTKMVESMTTAFSILDSWVKKSKEKSTCISLLGLSISTVKLKTYLLEERLRERQQIVNIMPFLLLLQENYTQLLLCHFAHKYSTVAENQKLLGDAYLKAKQYEKAEHSYKAALESLEKLKKEQQDDFNQYADIAKVQNCLGEIFNKSKDYDRSEEYYLKALEICTQLFTQDPNAYREDLADTQHNLGNLYYYHLHDYAKAEEYYLKALENRSHLFVKDSSSDNCNDLAWTQYRLGSLYTDLHDYSKAEEFYLKALENRTRLFSQNPDVYREDLADTQHSLGNLYYFHLHDYAKSEECYLKALENRSQLFVLNSSSGNCNDLAWTQFRLGSLYCFHLNDYAKSEEYYLKALENRTQLFSQNPDVYRAELAMTQRALGSLYNFRLNNYVKAEEYILKALENHTQLFTQNPDAYREDLANSYNVLAYVYAHTQDYAKALETIDRAIELMPEEANLYDSKGEILLMKGDEQETVKMWQKVLELDPDFLKTHNSDLYKLLKEKGLIND